MLVVLIGTNRFGGAAPTPTQAVSGRLYVTVADIGFGRGFPILITGTAINGANITRHVTTGAQGFFGLRLPPGRYLASAITGGLSHRPPVRLVVSREHIAHVLITFLEPLTNF